ncbi:unnamed protein product [Dracunculus medinensis]|uniref:Transposase n=1 Tax=Dracunculus medinensis TaxID=318479 RepID=A0A0N4UH70_DRAME|nr:unnamed protein product [Dracunculus medinensis]
MFRTTFYQQCSTAICLNNQRLSAYVQVISNELFFRSPKWSRLSPSGGSLVSGRGNFRPGFLSRAVGNRVYLADPLLAFKRSESINDKNPLY